MESAGENGGIAGRVRAARERLGWTREELAVRAEISWSEITQVESGRRRNLRPATLAGLAGALGVSIDYLVHGGAAAPMLDHEALIYDGDETFAETAGAFLVQGVERSEALLAVSTPSNLDLLRDRLGSDREGVEFRESAATYLSPTAALEAYRDFVAASLDGGAPWVRIIGEPVWPAADPEVRHWTRYESIFNLVFAASPVSVLCPYDKRSLDPAIVAEARHTHPRTLEPGGLAESAEYRDPGGFAISP